MRQRFDIRQRFGIRQVFTRRQVFVYFSAFLFSMRKEFVGTHILGLFRLGIISLLGIVFLYIIIINDCVLYIIIIINICLNPLGFDRLFTHDRDPHEIKVVYDHTHIASYRHLHVGHWLLKGNECCSAGGFPSNHILSGPCRTPLYFMYRTPRKIRENRNLSIIKTQCPSQLSCIRIWWKFNVKMEEMLSEEI